MKVWILEKCYDYEGCEIVSVHATPEGAEVARQKLVADGTYADNLEVTEKEVLE